MVYEREPNVFYAADVEAITGVPKNRLQQWVKAGYISPSIEKAKGHGTQNKWDHGDLYDIQTFQYLIDRGWKRQHIADILNKERLCLGTINTYFENDGPGHFQTERFPNFVEALKFTDKQPSQGPIFQWLIVADWTERDTDVATVYSKSPGAATDGMSSILSALWGEDETIGLYDSLFVLSRTMMQIHVLKKIEELNI